MTYSFRSFVMLAGAATLGCSTSSSPSGRLTTVSIQPSTDTVIVKGATALTVTAFDQNHNPIDAFQASWHSLDTAVANVSADGNVTAKALGVARIVVEVGSLADTATILSVPKVVVSLDWPTMLVNDSIHASAVLRDALGGAVPGPAPIWSTTDSTRLSIRSDGGAIGHAPGTVSIVATALGGRGTASAVVVPAIVTTHLQISSIDASGHLTLRNRDGSGLTMLTDSLHTAQSYSWSADGNTLALWMYAMPGAPGPGSAVSLTTPGAGIGSVVSTAGELSAISPDGQRVAFIQQVNSADYDVFTAGAGGSGLADLTHIAGIETNPVWSPDGGYIAYRRDPAFQLWLAPIDAGPGVQVTIPYQVVNYRWSPDGRYIAFTAQDSSPGGTILYGAWLARRDGTGAVPLSPGCSIGGGCGAGEGNSSIPTWSPNGKELAFFSWEPGGPVVFVADLQGHALRTIPWRHCGADPVWAPDGRTWLAIDSIGADRYGNPRCGTIEADTLGTRIDVVDSAADGDLWRP